VSPALLLAEVLEAAAARAREIDAQASAERAAWIDQRQSPLGPRRHCRAVQARLAAGSADAAIIGRRQLLSQTALTEELARSAAKPAAKKQSVADELRRELHLVRNSP
jgi:hypothetical protein